MKKIIWIIVFGGIFLTNIFFYLKNDCKGYEYGFNSNFCKKNIPYGIKPNIDEYYYFDLVDEDGFELVGKGFKYQTTNFKINKLKAYGYKDSSILIECTDSLNHIKYLFSYETKYNNSKGKPEISFKELSKSKFKQIKNNYRWVDLDDNKIKSIYSKKLLSSIGVILSLLLLLWSLLRKRREVLKQ